MKVSDPLRRGLGIALQVTITLLSTGVRVTVLNGLVHTPGGVQRLLGRPAALCDHYLSSLHAREGGCPGEYRESSRRPTDGPLDTGTEG
jgi:hypothetical protein